MNLIPFPSTQWTRLAEEGATAAGREWFCSTYRPAVLAYLRTKMEHHEAEDVCQDFFAKVVLEGALMAKADPARGRLRHLMIRALDRHLSKHRRSAAAVKRGGRAGHCSFDEVQLADGAASHPDAAFDQAWARGLLDRALVATEADCRRRQKMLLFAALAPLLDGSGPARSHAAVAQELGLSAREVTLALSRLRQRVARHLYLEVLQTVQGGVSVQDEWESVRRALYQQSPQIAPPGNSSKSTASDGWFLEF